MSRPVVASVGCTDPWNAAGLGLDILALHDLGTRCVSVVAGVTAQDAAGVHAAAAVAPALLRAQLVALETAGIAAYRIGALLDVASVELIADWLADTALPVVYDPVLAPSGGGAFADDAVTRAIARRLMPRVSLVTPNLTEARRLAESFETDDATQPEASGVVQAAQPAKAAQPIEELERAAVALVGRGARAALVTGGDLPGGPVIDVLLDSAGSVVFEAPRLAGTLRGTGCLLACGIAAALAHGASLREAVEAGRTFVRGRFAHATEAGGMRLAY